MNRRLGIFAILVLGLFFPAPVFADPMKEWAFSSEIVPAQGTAPVTAVELNDRVLDGARRDLGDLRVVAENRQIPLMLAAQPAVQKKVSLAPVILSNTVTSSESVLVADLGEKKHAYNEILLLPARSNFVRRVTVEGSDDQIQWNGIRKEIVVYAFHFASSSELARYTGEIYQEYSLFRRYSEKNLTFEFPEVSYRYIKVIIPHDQDKEPVALSGVQIYRSENQPALETVRTGTLTGAEVDAQTKSVNVTVDFGNRNLPMERVEIDFAEGSFARGVEISASNDAKEWKSAGSGSLFSMEVDGEKRLNKTIFLGATRARYLKLRVINGDNKPIKITGVKSYSLKQFAVYFRQGVGPHLLFYGHPDATQPSYDINRLLADKNVSTFAQTKLSPEIKNPVYAPAAKTKVWTESHPKVLLIVMGAVVLGLMGLAFQVVKETGRK